MYGQRVQQMQDYCCTIARTYSVRSRNGSVRRRESLELVRTERGNGNSEGSRRAEEEEKEESTVSPECIDSTVAQFSLFLSPSFSALP